MNTFQNQQQSKSMQIIEAEATIAAGIEEVWERDENQYGFDSEAIQR